MNWTMIFSQSKANGAQYLGDQLPPQTWKWPKGTWLQNRLRELRKKGETDAINRAREESEEDTGNGRSR